MVITVDFYQAGPVLYRAMNSHGSTLLICPPKTTGLLLSERFKDPPIIGRYVGILYLYQINTLAPTTLSWFPWRACLYKDKKTLELVVQD